MWWSKQHTLGLGASSTTLTCCLGRQPTVVVVAGPGLMGGSWRGGGGKSRCGGSGNINKGSTACGSSVNKDDIKNEVSDNNNSSGSANGRRHGEASM